MSNFTCPPHEHVLEMFTFIKTVSSVNPPVLETYEANSHSLIERRQFTDMIQLVNHVVFLAQMQTQNGLAGHVQNILESWVLRRDVLPNQFIYETADLFASIGYRFRVMQWSTREEAFDELASATATVTVTLENAENAYDIVLDGSRIYKDYRCFTPWAINCHEGKFHDSNVPQRPEARVAVYKTKIKPDHICIGFSCNFCTKIQKDFLAHEAKHWEPSHPCVCAQLDQRIIAKELDKTVCRQCGKLCIDQDARMMRNWEDAKTGNLIRKFGKIDEMRAFANTTAIQMQRDVTMPDMGQHLTLNAKNWQ